MSHERKPILPDDTLLQMGEPTRKSEGVVAEAVGHMLLTSFGRVHEKAKSALNYVIGSRSDVVTSLQSTAIYGRSEDLRVYDVYES